MAGPEAAIERTICKEAEDAGWLVYKLTFIGVNGAPDRLFGRDGRAILIEFKRPGEEPTRQQYRRHQELRDYFGFEVAWADSLSGARDILGLGGW